MPGKRYFTDEELEEMGKVTRDLILEAIDRGDLQQARELTDRMYREFLGMHDLYVYWLTATLSHVGRTFGNDALYEALRSGCDAWVTPLARRYAGKDLKTRVRMLVAGLRGHLHPLRVEEDDEKVTVYLKPCGSGGRMILNGAYKPPYDFLEIDPSQPMTFDRQKFPVYCAHEMFMALLPMEAGLMPFAVVEPSSDFEHEPCRFILYKRPDAIPEKVFEQTSIGKQDFLRNVSSKGNRESS